MKRVLITGITGYIGAHLAKELLKCGIEVNGLVRQPLNTTYISDIQHKLNLYIYDGTYDSVLNAIKQADPDFVFHLATYYARNHSAQELTAMNHCNILYGNYVLEAMRTCEVRHIVYTSTVFCHYQQDSYNPLNLYAATKQAFFDLMKYYTDAYGIKSITLFLSDSYGPNDKRSKLLNLLKNACLENQPINVSSGQQDYDILYISDIVDALIHAGSLLPSQNVSSVSYQIYSDRCHSLKDTVSIMEQVNQISIPVNWGALPTSTRSIQKAVRVYPLLPGWHAKVGLEAGLQRFWDSGSNCTIFKT